MSFTEPPYATPEDANGPAAARETQATGPEPAVTPVNPVPRRSAGTRFLAWVIAVDLDDLAGAAVARVLVGALLLLVVPLVATGSAFIFATDLLRLEMPAATCFGLFWGYVIFTLDRNIVISLDGSRGLRRLATGVVRLAMAALVGWVISHPLLLRTFDGEVQSEISRYAIEQKNEGSKDIGSNPEYGTPAITSAQKKVDDLQKTALGASAVDVSTDPEVTRLQAEYNKADADRKAQQQKVECESDGSCGTGSRGDGPEWQRKKDELQRLEADANRLRSELDNARTAAALSLAAHQGDAVQAAQDDLPKAKAELTELERKRDAEIARRYGSIESENGLGARMDALGRLRQRRPAIDQQYWAIAAVLILVDTSAVLLKLMQPTSPEDRLRQERAQARLEVARLVMAYELEETKTELAEDALLRDQHRKAERELHEAQFETFVDQGRAEARDPSGSTAADMLARSRAAFGARMGARSAWRTE